MTTIMTVCTGNICRSPAAELLLGVYLGPLASLTSAGTHAMVGHGIPAEMLMCLDAEGIDGRGHRAQQLTAGLIREADLVIAMAAQHRAWAMSEAPFALKRTFTLSEIAAAAADGVHLPGSTPGERLAHVADAVAGHRPHLAGRSLADIPDPYGNSQRAYDESYALMREAIDAIAAWIRQ